MRNQETKFCSKCQCDLPVDYFSSVTKKSGNGKVYEFRRPHCDRCRSQEAQAAYRKRVQSRPDRHCRVCGSTLPKQNTKRMYCSRQCASKAARPERKAEIRSCHVCKKSFATKHPTKKYCSTVCYLKSYLPVATVRDCEYCGKGITKPRARYCSPECWKVARREKQRIRETARQEKILSLPRDLTIGDWRKALAYFDNKCAYCGDHLTKAEQDHFVPVKQGGGYTKDNIVPACRSCNSKKRAKNPIEWLAGLPNALIAYARITHYFNRVKQG